MVPENTARPVDASLLPHSASRDVVTDYYSRNFVVSLLRLLVFNPPVGCP